MLLAAGVCWAARCKDAGSPDSERTIGAPEDTAARRPARFGAPARVRQILLGHAGATRASAGRP
jgi:hypothetical protein